MSCLISLNNITFKYNLETVLENIDFSINAGEKVALTGHNGCGKSTLMQIMSGKLTGFEGERVLKKALRFESVEQYLPAELREFTLIEALQEKLPPDEKDYLKYKAEILLEELYFEHHEFNTKVKNLSGGGQNRLMFARAIINEPELVFMDEPTNHLDLKSLLYLESYIKTKASFATAVISHDKTFLGNITSKTVILRDKMSHCFDLSYAMR